LEFAFFSPSNQSYDESTQKNHNDVIIETNMEIENKDAKVHTFF
jgi:hypothetical protein